MHCIDDGGAVVMASMIGEAEAVSCKKGWCYDWCTGKCGFGHPPKYCDDKCTHECHCLLATPSVVMASMIGDAEAVSCKKGWCYDWCTGKCGFGHPPKYCDDKCTRECHCLLTTPSGQSQSSL
ncbi:unnamed protein product [Microthlaspi erraticum]|uniref:Uncharacterized protein n=1 Tax=Microthlaspi erraticum TaxID=1685480 RepID=A0A6D2IN77_9BRAS|nr:unnamed protein product [Microthlaspi erraticum]